MAVVKKDKISHQMLTEILSVANQIEGGTKSGSESSFGYFYISVGAFLVIDYMMVTPATVTCKAGQFVDKAGCYAVVVFSQQCNIFIGCKPNGYILHTGGKSTTLNPYTTATNNIDQKYNGPEYRYQ